MAHENGMVHVASRYSVDDTVNRLQAAFMEKGLQVFAVIDHSGEAQKKVGLKMRLDEGRDLWEPKGWDTVDGGGS